MRTPRAQATLILVLSLCVSCQSAKRSYVPLEGVVLGGASFAQGEAEAGSTALDPNAPRVTFSAVPAKVRGGSAWHFEYAIMAEEAIVAAQLQFSTDGDTDTDIISLDGSEGQQAYTFERLDVVAARLRLVAIDGDGRLGWALSAPFIIDSTGPAVPSFTLDSGTVTNQPLITLRIANCGDAASILVSESATALSGDETAASWQPCTASAPGREAGPSILLPPTQGIHTLYVWARDDVGNPSTSSDLVSLLLDTVVPSPPEVVRTTPGLTHDRAVGLAVVDCADRAYVLVSEGAARPDANDAGWQLCQPTLPLFEMTSGEGVHTLSVWAKDMAGNVSEAASSIDVTLDQLAPAPPLVLPESVTSHHDTQILSGSCEADAVEVQVFVDALLDQSVPCAAGQFSAMVARSDDAAYVLDARAIDAAGNVSESSASVTWTRDTVVPVVTSVSAAAANGAYPSGTMIALQVSFSEPVTVSGAPQMTLETGTDDAVADYASGSSSATLTFYYLVATGQQADDLDYASALALALNGGTIRDAADNDAVLTLALPGAPGSLGHAKDMSIDTAGPLITLTSLTGGQVILGGVPTSISWTQSSDPHPAAQPITVQFSSNSGASWNPIAGPKADVGSQAWTPPSGTLATYRVRVIAADALGNETIAESSSDFTVSNTDPPTPWLLRINGQASPPSTSHNNALVELQAGPDGFADITHFCLKSNNSMRPAVNDPCWIPVNAPIPGLPVSPSLHVIDFTYRIGFTPNTTYTVRAWVKSSLGLISTNSGSVGADLVSIHYQPFAPPLVTNVTATSIDNPCSPNRSIDVAVVAGNEVFVKWYASSEAGFGATPIALSYTTDDVNYIPIPGASALTNGVNGGCNLESPPNDDCSAVDTTAKTGCFHWDSAPLSTYFKVRVTATDVDSASSVTSAIPPMNVFPPINFLAGNPDPGLGGSVSSVPLLSRQISSYDQPDLGSFVVTSRGGIYFRDYDNGLLWVDPSSGNVTRLIAITGSSTGANGSPATNATLNWVCRLDLDYQDRLYIWDNDRVRRVEVDENGSPTTISTVLGGGTDYTSDGIAPTAVRLDTCPRATNAGFRQKLTVLPNGDMYFMSKNAGTTFATGFRFRKYSASTDLVTSIVPSGTGYLGNPSADLSTCSFVTHAGPLVIYEPTTSTVNGLAYTIYDSNPASACHYFTYLSKAVFSATGADLYPAAMSAGMYNYGKVQDDNWVGLDGNHYAMNAGRVARYNLASNTWTPVLGNGGTTSNCSDGTAALACAINLQDIFVDQQGRIFWLAYGVIRTLDQSGNVVTIAGEGMSSGDGGSALSAHISRINSARTWRSGNTDAVVIVDPISNKVREAVIGGDINAIAGNGAYAWANNFTGSATGQPFLIQGYNGYNATGDIAVDSANGTVYAWQNNRILKLDRMSGNWQIFVGGGPNPNYWMTDGLAGNTITPNIWAPSFTGLAAGSLYVGALSYAGTGCGAAYCYQTMKSFNVSTTVQSAYLAQQQTVPTMPCPLGTPVSQCNPVSTVSTYDAVGGRWIMSRAGASYLVALTLVSVPLDPGGLITQLVTLPRTVVSFAFHDDNDGGKHQWVYYCGTTGRLYKYNVGTEDGGVETALDWPISNLSCVGYTYSNYMHGTSLTYDSNRQSLVFPYKENGLYGVAEYVNP